VSYEKSIVMGIVDGKISLQEAEWRLRSAFGAGQTNSKYQSVYNYLDEVAGMLDGNKETQTNRQQFVDFLQKLGFPEGFD
jgi:hypothetical protein